MMQTGRFSITARSVPDCEAFLKLKYNDNDFLKIEDFIKEPLSLGSLLVPMVNFQW